MQDEYIGGCFTTFSTTVDLLLRPGWTEGKQGSRASHRDVRDQHHLDLCLSPIDEQFDSGDETAVIRGKEQGSFRDFVRVAQPPQRHSGREERQDLLTLLLRLPQATEARCVDRTRTDGVDADLAGFQVDGPGARE